MYIPKKYGKSKIDSCPFCDKIATIKNLQEVPVCPGHKDNLLPDLKCICDGYLDLKTGKFGIYFNCMNCGNINLKKALSMNPHLKNNSTTRPVDSTKGSTSSNTEKTKKKTKTEITITSDQVDTNYS